MSFTEYCNEVNAMMSNGGRVSSRKRSGRRGDDARNTWQERHQRRPAPGCGARRTRQAAVDATRDSALLGALEDMGPLGVVGSDNAGTVPPAPKPWMCPPRVKPHVLKHVSAEKKRYADGYIPTELEKLEIEMREAKQKSEAVAKITSRVNATARAVEIGVKLEAIERKVKVAVFGMAGTEARVLRAKNTAMQAAKGLLLSDEEWVDYEIDEWIFSLVTQCRCPEGIELEVTAPMSEDKFRQVADHHRATMKNQRLVESATGSVWSRVRAVQEQGGDAVMECRKAFMKALGDVSTFASSDCQVRLQVLLIVMGVLLYTYGFLHGFISPGFVEESGLLGNLLRVLWNLIVVNFTFTAGVALMFSGTWDLFSRNLRVKTWKNIATD